MHLCTYLSIHIVSQRIFDLQIEVNLQFSPKNGLDIWSHRYVLFFSGSLTWFSCFSAPEGISCPWFLTQARLKRAEQTLKLSDSFGQDWPGSPWGDDECLVPFFHPNGCPEDVWVPFCENGKAGFVWVSSCWKFMAWADVFKSDTFVGLQLLLVSRSRVNQDVMSLTTVVIFRLIIQVGFILPTKFGRCRPLEFSSQLPRGLGKHFLSYQNTSGPIFLETGSTKIVWKHLETSGAKNMFERKPSKFCKLIIHANLAGRKQN